jgi:hypothetical protein
MTNDVIQATPKRGDTCANGAIILEVKSSWSESPSWIVLCLFIESKHDPYVTWVSWYDDAGKLRTVMGHYHDRLSQAIVDFDSRS